MTNQEMKQRLDCIIEGIREKYHVPSIVVSVHKDGESFFCGGGELFLRRGGGSPPPERQMRAPRQLFPKITCAAGRRVLY